MTVRRLLSLFALLSLMLAACGGDGDSADDAAEDATEVTGADAESPDAESPDAESPEADAPDVDAPDADAPGDDEGGSGGGLPSDVDFGECGFLADFPEAFGDVDTEVNLSGETYSRWASEVERAAANAPSEIRDQFGTMAEGFRQLADAFEGTDIDFSDPEAMMNDPAAMQAMEDMGQIFEDAEFDQAAEEIEQWMEANCPDLVN